MDILEFKEFLIRYTLGKSRSVHELRVLAPNIVLAREEALELHRDGNLYPRNFSAYQSLKITSIREQ